MPHRRAPRNNNTPGNKQFTNTRTKAAKPTYPRGVKSARVPDGARCATDISPVRVRNSALNRGLGVIVGQARRISPQMTHDHRSIPYGGIDRAA
jgi:hypothetical protein